MKIQQMKKHVIYLEDKYPEKDVFLAYENSSLSSFVMELKNSNFKMKFINKEEEISADCPVCNDIIAKREQKADKNNKFYSCTNFLCDFTVNIPQCNNCKKDEIIINAHSSDGGYSGDFICKDCNAEN